MMIAVSDQGPPTLAGKVKDTDIRVQTLPMSKTPHGIQKSFVLLKILRNICPVSLRYTLLSYPVIEYKFFPSSIKL